LQRKLLLTSRTTKRQNHHAFVAKIDNPLLWLHASIIMRQIALMVSILLMPSITYAHANESLYIVGGVIFLVQIVLLLLVLTIKIPIYTLLCLISIISSWVIASLASDQFINIDPIANFLAFLIFTPLLILIVAKYHSVRRRKSRA
jgi:hypothetical protein